MVCQIQNVENHWFIFSKCAAFYYILLHNNATVTKYWVGLLPNAICAFFYNITLCFQINYFGISATYVLTSKTQCNAVNGFINCMWQSNVSLTTTNKQIHNQNAVCTNSIFCRNAKSFKITNQICQSQIITNFGLKTTILQSVS